jgi:signal transduction histidine kinase/CheY-like chemotaxis protein
MGNLTTDRLLSFTKRLRQASTFAELLIAARDEASVVAGYSHAWLLIASGSEMPAFLRLVDVVGSQAQIVRSVLQQVDLKVDSLLQDIVASEVPIVIEDARSDPRTNKEIATQLGNRASINIPVHLFDNTIGVLGLGTFNDEGGRQPSEEELSYFVAMAAQVSVAAARIQFAALERGAENDRLEMQHRLGQVQRLESLGLLAGGVAHDFNNLLTVIVSSLSMAANDLAGSDPPNEAILEDVNLAAEAANRASKLTRQLLAMGRSQELDLRPLQANDHLSALIDLLRRIMPPGIVFELIRKSALPPISADGHQLDQVFVNLCLNSRDAMPNGGRITIETELVHVNGPFVQTHPWARIGDYVLVTFTDTGAGIPRGIIDRIFDPFFTTKTADQGTGLGLSVSYGIIRQHEGMIHCYSEVGRGTVFRIYLPVTPVGEHADAPKSRPHNVIGTERVLIVEDDPGVLDVVTRILEGAGYVVKAARNGQEALDLVARAPVDLVILDMVMPGLKTDEVLDRLRMTSTPVRILLSSGYSVEAEGIRDILQKTRHPLLTKPYDPDALLRAVRRVLEAPIP